MLHENLRHVGFTPDTREHRETATNPVPGARGITEDFMHGMLDHNEREGGSQQLGIGRETDAANRKGPQIVREPGGLHKTLVWEHSGPASRSVCRQSLGR